MFRFFARALLAADTVTVLTVIAGLALLMGASEHALESDEE